MTSGAAASKKCRYPVPKYVPMASERASEVSGPVAMMTGLHVGKSLGHITAQSVLAVLECVHGEEAHVLKAHGIAALEEDAQVSLLVGDGSFHDNLILLPVGGSDVESLLHKLLVLAH